jgi:hypothetical protein
MDFITYYLAVSGRPTLVISKLITIGLSGIILVLAGKIVFIISYKSSTIPTGPLL